MGGLHQVQIRLPTAIVVASRVTVFGAHHFAGGAAKVSQWLGPQPPDWLPSI